MLASVKYTFSDYALIIQNTPLHNSIEFSELIDKKPSIIILPNINVEDLAWFKELLKNLKKLIRCAVSFQGTVICSEAYEQIKLFQIDTKNSIQFSFSVETAINSLLNDSDIISKINYSFGSICVQPYNTKWLTYGIFKQIIPYAIELKNIIKEKQIQDTIGQIIYIDNWVQKNIQYIKSGNFTALGNNYCYKSVKEEAIVTDVFKNHYGVCEDISASISAVLSLLDIKSEVIADNGHAWNIVCIDGAWYIWDCTRNITRNKYQVKNELMSSRYNHEYLLRGASFENGDYCLKNAFYEDISSKDYPRSIIENRIKQMAMNEIITIEFDSFIEHANEWKDNE